MTVGMENCQSTCMPQCTELTRYCGMNTLWEEYVLCLPGASNVNTLLWEEYVLCLPGASNVNTLLWEEYVPCLPGASNVNTLL